MIKFTPGKLDENGIFSYKASGENADAVCTAKLDGSKLYILSVKGRNAYTAYADPDEAGAQLTAVLRMLGFEDEKGMLVCDIPDALTGSCCRCK